MNPVVVTPGDPAGIGAEITLKAFAAGLRGFCVMDDPDRLERLASDLGLDVAIERLAGMQAAKPDGERLGVIPLEWPQAPIPGKPLSANAPVVIECIRQAAQLARGGEACAMTTNPVNKAVLASAGFEHPGHTEFLASLCPAVPGAPVMLLVGAGLRVVPVTIHMPLRKVATCLTTEEITLKARILADALRLHFGCDSPRLAVCGLNPHAGEGGVLGDEDAQIIEPAIKALRDAGIKASGPHAADSLFHPAARQSYDAVVAMYHDQALIPVKTLDFEGAVNVTLGLDFIRTSPDHGTAFDIAGSGQANPGSLMAAVELAKSMAASASRDLPAQSAVAQG